MSLAVLGHHTPGNRPHGNIGQLQDQLAMQARLHKFVVVIISERIYCPQLFFTIYSHTQFCQFSLI